MINYYFTFGSNHKDKYGNSLGHAYVKVQATDFYEARQEMFKYRGKDWAFQYNDAEFLPQIPKYNLHEVAITEV